jgi:hypothetical protein
MKLKNFLENQLITTPGGLFGEDLHALELFFDDFDELKGKEVKIIDSIKLKEVPQKLEQELVLTKHFETIPELITVKFPEGYKTIVFNKSVSLYGFFLKGGEVFVRCTPDSIATNIK